jgi:hypothetical protein
VFFGALLQEQVDLCWTSCKQVLQGHDCKVGNGNVDNINGSRQGNEMMLWLGKPEGLL